MGERPAAAALPWASLRAAHRAALTQPLTDAAGTRRWFPTAWSQPGPVPMVAAGADCDWIPADGTNAAGLSGRAALVSLTRLPSTDLRAPCNYVRLMRAATGAGATALVMVAPTGGDAAPANCTGSGPRSPINGCAAQQGAPGPR